MVWCKGITSAVEVVFYSAVSSAAKLIFVVTRLFPAEVTMAAGDDKKLVSHIRRRFKKQERS